MSLLDYFNVADVDRFGKELANIVIEALSERRLPKEQKKIEEKERALLDRVALRIAQFKVDKNLNFYKKARLANSFKWSLLESGFTHDLVDELTKFVVIQLR